MSEVKRFRADHRHAVETAFDDAQYVGVADFDRLTAENQALQQRLTTADQRIDELETQLAGMEQRCQAEQQACQAAERRLTDCNIESAAMVLANCMDYPWQHMPENGRSLMRRHAKDVIDAALNPTTENQQ
jgi:hypothetical protein